MYYNRNERLSQTVQLRVTPKLLKNIEARAYYIGLSKSDYIRLAIIIELGQQRKLRFRKRKQKPNEIKLSFHWVNDARYGWILEEKKPKVPRSRALMVVPGRNVK